MEIMVKFALGQVVSTPGALKALEESKQIAADFLYRHERGDWGALPMEDVVTQMHSLQSDYPERIMSAYVLKNGERIWIITEWDRSVTTILLPEEY